MVLRGQLRGRVGRRPIKFSARVRPDRESDQAFSCQAPRDRVFPLAADASMRLELVEQPTNPRPWICGCDYPPMLVT